MPPNDRTAGAPPREGAGDVSAAPDTRGDLQAANKAANAFNGFAQLISEIVGNLPLVEGPVPPGEMCLFLALLDAKKDAEYHVYPNQGHFPNGQSWVQMMQRTADFFATHLIE